jgi:hypothetical protein
MDRWAARRAARPAPATPASAGGRPLAEPEREVLVRRRFPYRDMSPAAYLARYGDDIRVFSFDQETYADPELDAWIAELGRLLAEEDGA